MFEIDAFHLARIQFAFTVSFHIIFPAITIGLASYLVVLEGLWLKQRREYHLRVFQPSSRRAADHLFRGVWLCTFD